MPRVSKISSDQLLEMKDFFALSDEQRHKLAEAMSGPEVTIAASKLLSKFIEIVPDRRVARHALRQLLFFAEYARINRCSSDEAFADIAKALEKNENWSADDKAKLGSLRDWIQNIANSVSIYGSAKALTLSYDTEKVFMGLRAILDVRPVYDSARESLIGAVVFNTLRIEFSDSGEVKSYSLAANLDDLQNIRLAVEDAIRKSKQAQAWLTSPKSLPSFIRGDEKYGFD